MLQRVAKAWLDMTRGYRQDHKRSVSARARFVASFFGAASCCKHPVPAQLAASAHLSPHPPPPARSAFGTALFHEPIVSAGSDGLVIVRDITFAALSEHTLLPFHGRCHIAYVPRHGVVLGLSKLARVTKCLAARLQTQQAFTERLIAAVAEEVRLAVGRLARVWGAAVLPACPPVVAAASACGISWAGSKALLVWTAQRS